MNLAPTTVQVSLAESLGSNLRFLSKSIIAPVAGSEEASSVQIVWRGGRNDAIDEVIGECDVVCRSWQANRVPPCESVGEAGAMMQIDEII